MRRRLFGSRKGPVSPLMAVAGDVLLNDIYTNENIIVPIDDLNLIDYPSSQFLPTGVVVVPGSHDVYGDGSCGIMAIRTMCGDNYYGDYSLTISDVENGLYVNDGKARGHIGFLGVKFPITTKSNYWCTGTIADPDNETTYPSEDGTLLTVLIMPTDLYSSSFDFTDNGATINFPVGNRCSHDDEAFYISEDVVVELGQSPSSVGVCPSPYLTGGLRNPEFYRTDSPSSGLNSFSDFNGRGNTDGWLNFVEESVEYNLCYDTSMFAICSYFAAPGTSKTDWYLPAIGEWGYIMSRVRRINDSINYCRTLYGDTVGVEIAINYDPSYQSSTEFNEEGGSMQSVRTLLSEFKHDGKRAWFFCRAMMRMNSQGIVKSSFVIPDGWDDCISEIGVVDSADSN